MDTCYRHIMMATQGPIQLDKRAVERARALADIHGSKLSLLHVLPNLKPGLEYSLPVYDEDEHDVLEHARTEAMALESSLHASPHVQVVKSSAPSKTISEHVQKEKADLIVVSNKASGLRALFTLARSIMCHQPCDVLIVKG